MVMIQSIYGPDIQTCSARVRFLSDAGVLVDGEQRNWTQRQRRCGDRRSAAGSRIGDSLRRLSTMAVVLRCHLLYSLHANRHPGKSHHGDCTVSHQKGL